MMRVVSLAAITAVALFSEPARATDPAPRNTTVTSVSIVPNTGRAEVVIGVAGNVEVEDFALNGPFRIVLDLNGATLGLAPRLYDRVARGGVKNVRYAQYKKDIVRVVIDLDTTREYTINRSDKNIRISISGPTSRFDSWHSTTPLVLVADAVVREPQAEEVQTRTVMPASKFAALQQSTQPRITVTYQDADIRDVLAAFAAFSGRTIVVGKGVEGKVTAEVRDQPWDVAMNAILQSQGLAAAEDNNGIITVDSYASSSFPSTTPVRRRSSRRSRACSPRIARRPHQARPRRPTATRAARCARTRRRTRFSSPKCRRGSPTSSATCATSTSARRRSRSRPRSSS
jgi:hypothetical protein